jgi:copper homeostasis protein
MNEKPLLEICVDSAESALAAERGGANRIELCGNLLEGGVTPSAGLIAVTRKSISISLHVMIRPRGGDFTYTSEEFEVMKRDIDIAKNFRAEGVVLGILNRDRNVDQGRTRELVERARPLVVTFHRAFDMVRNLPLSLEDVIQTGADRILTSGGEPKAEDALQTIAALVQKAAGRIMILVGGGIRDHNVKRILEATHAREIHVGHSGVEGHVPNAARHGHPQSVVSEEKVRKLVEAF